MQKKYMICEAPLCVGAPTQGTEHAFSHLIKNGLEKHIGKEVDLTEFKGERTLPPVKNDKRLRELETVMHVNREHYKNLVSAFDRGYMPITIGGDHSLAMASIAALSDTVGTKQVAVIYIDGHTDINTEQTTESGYIHGMPLAAAMGLCCDELTVGNSKVHLIGKNTYIIGARSIDSGEYPIIEREGVSLYTADDVKARGYECIMDEVLEKVRNMSVHVSFDVDAIDGSEFSSTGYVMPGGLSFETVYRIIEKTLRGASVASFDCVEYNPLFDSDGSDMKKLFKIFSLFS